MKHVEYKRIINGSKKAFLFIHGIVGTPDQFADIIDLVPEDVTFWNMLLDGHGGRVKDFAATSMKKWEAQVERAVDELSRTHQEIYIVAHSMGTLLAMEQAMKNSKIVGLFFLQVPIRVAVSPRMVTSAMRVILDRIDPDDVKTLAAKRCFGIEPSLNLFAYITWLPRYFELFKKMRDIRRIIHEVSLPCVAFQSDHDELVSRRSAKFLRKHSSLRVFDMKDSGHFYYDESDLVSVRNELIKFIGGEMR